MQDVCPRCLRLMDRVNATEFLCPIHPPSPSPSAPEIVSRGGGYYDVVLGGEVMNADPLRGKTAAHEFAESL